MTTLRIITRDERRDEDCFVKLKHTGFLSPGVETGGGDKIVLSGYKYNIPNFSDSILHLK